MIAANSSLILVILCFFLIPKIMSFWEEEETLTRKLRTYSVKNVKITEADMARTKKLIKNCIEDQVMKYCQQNSPLPILRLEYTGSVYEGLKTEAADEADIMVVLKTARQEVAPENTEIPGYARLKARDNSKLRHYASSAGYIFPERLRNGWFNSLVARAVNNFNNTSISDVHLGVRYHGPASQIDIREKTTNEILLSTDLVPCFQTGPDDYFVPKSYTFKGFSHPELLWRQSFSLKEKAILQHMDTDQGCRHELLRVVKTIVNKEERSSLRPFGSYHLKTAFMHYIKENPVNWDNNSLGRHFHGFLQRLQTSLAEKNLPHYWLPRVNLLEEDFSPVVIHQMENRLENILTSKAKLNQVLGCKMPQTETQIQKRRNPNILNEPSPPAHFSGRSRFDVPRDSYSRRNPQQWTSASRTDRSQNAESKTQNPFSFIALGLMVIKIIFDILIINPVELLLLALKLVKKSIMIPVELLLFALKLIKKAIMIMLEALVVALQLFVEIVCYMLCFYQLSLSGKNERPALSGVELKDSPVNQTDSI